ncbi:LysE family translocator [Cellulomonas cellasea]|uniref:Threonine/homoserine/homoserine lactone efflux protein n=1 Tax=Cellulomonas cellasea TaxID=43670 RepID=A0A7W4UHN6_9CELL|nr:LysE family translocator [Cellulomonas cellasea]MBB2924345.1 threonine/homoserine/homoserine lactone efflux protein [Cellulomonas cellasea]
MTVTQAVLSFALVAGLLTIVPGLDTALVLRSAISRGRAHAFAAGAGINAGCFAWGVAAAVGASALLAASRTAYTVLTLAGAAYMVLLGAQLLWSSLRRRPAVDGEPDGTPAAPEPRGSVGRAFLMGLGTNLLNPKVGVFYLATIPQFVPDGVSPLLMGVLLAAVHNVLGMAWFAAIILATGFASRWLSGEVVARVTDRVTGIVLVAFGVRLAATARALPA